MNTTVLSLGGSIIIPDSINTGFLKDFVEAIKQYTKNGNNRFIIVCGGGSPARVYQTAYRQIITDPDAQDSNLQDWMGIRATHLNAQLVKSIFGQECKNEIVTNPTAEDLEFTGNVLVAGGWKPGFSTDTDAVYLAKRFGAEKIFNLSNIDWVYTDDPKKNPDAKMIEKISWPDFRKIVGDSWVPGKNTPFDPIASKLAQEAGITVICTNGKDLENLKKHFDGISAKGTIIG